MSTQINILRVIHVVNAVLMAWPFYALMVVNQRVRLGPPLGDRADTYMENIIKNRTIPCFIFQITAMISGLALMWRRGLGLDDLISNSALGLKFFLLVVIGGLLSYVHLNLQPEIDALFARAGRPMPDDIASRIGALRVRRKRLASVCTFVVLVSTMLGMQVWVSFPLWLTLLFTLAIVGFTWRAYASAMEYGWA